MPRIDHKLPEVSSKYGAPMGRREGDADYLKGRCYLVHQRLDSGGYDSGGAYWGLGQRLYQCRDVDGETVCFIRAYDRADARAQLEDQYDGIQFKRP